MPQQKRTATVDTIINVICKFRWLREHLQDKSWEQSTECQAFAAPTVASEPNWHAIGGVPDDSTLDFYRKMSSIELSTAMQVQCNYNEILQWCS